MCSILLRAVLLIAAGQVGPKDGPELPAGSPAEQVAAIRARLEAERAEALTDEAEELMRELVSNSQYAAAEWPPEKGNARLGELAKRDQRLQSVTICWRRL